MEDILNKLKEEHRIIQTILLKIERGHGQKLKREYYAQLKSNLIPHMEGEEKTLYAKLKSEVHDENAAKIVKDADFEHQEIKDLLKMLDEVEDMESSDWDELFEELKETIQLHVHEEEHRLFDEAKEDFSREELVQFGTEFEEAKTHAHP